MLPRNRIDLAKVCRERIIPNLNTTDARRMEEAIKAPLRRSLITQVSGKAHWYILDAPPSCRQRHGVAESVEKAVSMIAGILGIPEERVAYQ